MAKTLKTSTGISSVFVALPLAFFESAFLSSAWLKSDLLTWKTSPKFGSCSGIKVVGRILH